MRGAVEGLGDIKGQDMIPLLSPLQFTLCHKHLRLPPLSPAWPRTASLEAFLYEAGVP